jgi:hypothetical protein
LDLLGREAVGAKPSLPGQNDGPQGLDAPEGRRLVERSERAPNASP